jgi:hypothetical protein
MVGYDAIDERRSHLPQLIENGFLILSDGRRVRIVEREGWFTPQMTSNSLDSSTPSPGALKVGGGLSGPDCENDFGSIGGFAEDATGERYFVTCEHVIRGARRAELRKPPLLRSKLTKFILPSGGPRKMALITTASAHNPDKQLNANFLSCLLSHFDTPQWKQLLRSNGSGDQVSDLTLRRW